jgi:hypothetical protein
MRSVDVAVMHHTTRRTLPYSYPQCAQSTRASARTAHRASHTGVGFVDFAVDHAQPFGLVFQACAKLAPARIIDGLGHGGFGELGTGDVADGYQACTLDNGRGGLDGVFPAATAWAEGR